MKNLLYLLCLFSVHFAFAQSELPEDFGDYRLIKNTEVGRSYLQSYIPPTFKKNVSNVLLLENNRHLLTNLTEGKDYEIITEIVETRPAYTVWEFETPKIDTIIETKTIIVDRICEEIEPMPKFENQVITDRIEVLKYELSFIHISPKRVMETCTKIPIHSIIYAQVEVPARYASIEKRVFQKDGKWWTETITDTLNVSRTKYKSPFHKITKNEMAAIKDTFQTLHFINKTPPNNAKFSIIEQQIIDKQGHFSEWQAVICTIVCNLQAASIRPIQERLKAKGYEVEVNNIFDDKTKAVLIQFQKDNDLPQGQLDVETLKMLGVEF